MNQTGLISLFFSFYKLKSQYIAKKLLFHSPSNLLQNFVHNQVRQNYYRSNIFTICRSKDNNLGKEFRESIRYTMNSRYDIDLARDTILARFHLVTEKSFCSTRQRKTGDIVPFGIVWYGIDGSENERTIHPGVPIKSHRLPWISRSSDPSSLSSKVAGVNFIREPAARSTTIRSTLFSNRALLISQPLTISLQFQASFFARRYGTN